MINETHEHLPECECHEEHSDLIERGRAVLPETTELYDLSDFFKVLGDSTRLGILFAIDGAPMCVCDIAGVLGMTNSAVSHQLKSLRQASLVSYKKSGKNVFYELADDHVKSIIDIARVHLNHV